jgi:hypothetical protein
MLISISFGSLSVYPKDTLKIHTIADLWILPNKNSFFIIFSGYKLDEKKETFEEIYKIVNSITLDSANKK